MHVKMPAAAKTLAIKTENLPGFAASISREEYPFTTEIAGIGRCPAAHFLKKPSPRCEYSRVTSKSSLPTSTSSRPTPCAGITFGDRDELKRIAEQARASDYQLASLIEAFTSSPLFQKR